MARPPWVRMSTACGAVPDRSYIRTAGSRKAATWPGGCTAHGCCATRWARSWCARGGAPAGRSIPEKGAARERHGRTDDGAAEAGRRDGTGHGRGQEAPAAGGTVSMKGRVEGTLPRRAERPGKPWPLPAGGQASRSASSPLSSTDGERWRPAGTPTARCARECGCCCRGPGREPARERMPSARRTRTPTYRDAAPRGEGIVCGGDRGRRSGLDGSQAG